MRQRFIFLPIFSAHRMYAFPSSLIINIILARYSSEYKPVCASKSHLSKQCLTMFALRLSIYDLLHLGSWLLSRWPTGCTILIESIPINDLSGKSKMKAQWSPTPYPNGIMHDLLMLRSLDIRILFDWLQAAEKWSTWAFTHVLNNRFPQVQPLITPRLLS